MTDTRLSLAALLKEAPRRHEALGECQHKSGENRCQLPWHVAAQGSLFQSSMHAMLCCPDSCCCTGVSITVDLALWQVGMLYRSLCQQQLTEALVEAGAAWHAGVCKALGNDRRYALLLSYVAAHCCT
jgi:hypothetical protein